ncbi:TonB-dependent receptor [Simiduia sp. 21SJ11W-1]|uniref:TonB-dependent receptor n=1 Tax=Simiduia sp. 21SJ11W-1 TaxID=2909669 RepID=UPI00209D964F|nr:TonB-dependent receptor [Simiduia sp. 21SJ11W-1]UTA48291.1 TonB-dependent receptor [Simiduia sp. 21SJ11W-1]
MAQQAQDDALLVEEITVTGIRGSLQSSVDAKRDNSAIVDAISAEDISKFPDKNVAESLSRITGVSVTRDFGEGEKIAVRGTDPSQNRVLLNGASVTSVDWFTLYRSTRAFNYSILPSNVVSSLEVYKSPKADIQEGSLGGTVYLKTRRPLDLKANTLSLKAEGQYSDISGETDPLLSGLYSWKNDDETFGALLSLTSQERTVTRVGRETLGYDRVEVPGVAGDAEDGKVWFPKTVNHAIFTQDRKRETALASVQWRPTETFETTLNVLNTSLDANNQNYSYLATFNDGGNRMFDADSAVVEGGGVVAGQTLPTAGGAGPEAHTQWFGRDSSMETNSYDLSFSLNEDGYALSGRVGHSESDGGTPRQRYMLMRNFMDRVTFDKDLNLGLYIDGDRQESVAERNQRSLAWFNEIGTEYDDTETYGGLDFELLLEGDVFTSVKAGLLVRDRTKGQEQFLTSFHWWRDDQRNPDGSIKDGEARWFTEWNGDQTTLGGLAGGDSVDGYPLFDLGEAYRRYDPVAPFTGARVPVLAQTWEIKEDITAAYAMAEFDVSSQISGDVGVRVVQTNLTSSGYTWQNGDDVFVAGQLVGGYDVTLGNADANYNLQWDSIDHDYVNVLPNLNLSYNLNDDTRVRFSASKTMARQTFNDIAYQESYSTLTGAGTRGNPELDPTLANQFDLAYEWYFAEGSYVAATYFFKDISNNLTAVQTTEQRYDPQTDQDIDVVFTQLENGAGAKVHGLELSYQQMFGDFGVVTNYTYTDADSDEDRDPLNKPGSGVVMGNSKHMFNISPFYENDVFSARLSYSYRSEYLDNVHFYGNEYWTDEYGQFDFSATYAFNDEITLNFEGVNLTGEKIRQYHIEKAQLASLYENDTRFVLGITYQLD